MEFYIKIMFESDGFIAYSTNEIEEKKTLLIHTNQPLITSFYKKMYLFFAEIAMSQR